MLTHIVNDNRTKAQIAADLKAHTEQFLQNGGQVTVFTPEPIPPRLKRRRKRKQELGGLPQDLAALIALLG